MFLGFLFFKEKTAYEMRISDWSSDMCSSDLVAEVQGMPRHAKETAGEEALGINLLVQSATLDIGEPDDGGGQRLAGEGEREAGEVKPAVKGLAPARPVGWERDEERQQNQRRNDIPATEEEIAAGHTPWSDRADGHQKMPT